MYVIFLGGDGRGGCGGVLFFNDTEEQDVWSSLKEHMNKENLFVDFSYMLCFVVGSVTTSSGKWQ